MTRVRLTLVVVGLLGLILVGVVQPRMAGQILYCVMAVLAFIFAIQYASRSNWRSTAPGRALLYVVALLAVLSAWISVSFWLGDRYTDVKDIVRALLLIFMVVVLVNLLMTLGKIQRYRVEQVRIDSERKRACPNESSGNVDTQ